MKVYNLVFKKDGNGWAHIFGQAGEDIATVYSVNSHEQVLELLGRANAMSQFSVPELNALIAEAYSWREHVAELKKRQEEAAAKTRELEKTAAPEKGVADYE